MIGLPTTTDWSEFTRQNRLLDAGMPYGELCEPWQADIDAGIQRCPRVYLQLPRGHDKTERYAWWSMLWLETTRASRGYAAGVDRDNAKLFRDAAKKIKALHPDIFANVEIEKHVIFSRDTGSYVETISSDVQSAYGLNFDLLIVNDFHAWPDFEFWEVLWTACGKRPDIRVWMESNALTLGAPGAQWVSKFRRWAKEVGTQQTTTLGGPEWFFYCPSSFLATWQSKRLAEWRQTLLPATYRRLVDNQDASGEESFLTPEQVEACEVLLGPAVDRASDLGRCVTAVDMGLTHDLTVVATVQMLPRGVVVTEGVDPEGRPDGVIRRVRPQPKLVLLAMDALRGSKASPVAIKAAEELAFAHRERYRSWPILVDPWQMKSFAQVHHGVVEEWPFTGASVSQLTQVLYRCVADGCLQLYPGAGREVLSDGEEWDLKRELTNAVVKDMSYGQRVDHRSGGYSDRLMALGMACHKLLDGAVPHERVVREERRTTDQGAPDPEAVVEEWMREYDAAGRRWRSGNPRPINFS